MKPRIDDPRVGYFMEYITDQTSYSPTPYRDLITRWDLKEEVDPDAELSEPVEPIVWWIENTTPVETPGHDQGRLPWPGTSHSRRPGFKNAVQVQVQPDDADWDAGDIRYNVLRWTSSPQPPFGGYGPSFTNPRTGQIIGADIMLEFVFLTNRVRLERHPGFHRWRGNIENDRRQLQCTALSGSQSSVEQYVRRAGPQVDGRERRIGRRNCSMRAFAFPDPS